MKTVITLDPEYIPWEDEENLVPLIRSSSPILILAVVFLLTTGYWGVRWAFTASPMFGGGDDNSEASPAVAATATPTVGDVTPTATLPALPTPNLVGRAGAVGIKYTSSVMYLSCETWGRAEDQSLSTADGPLVNYEPGLVVWCNGEPIEVPNE